MQAFLALATAGLWGSGNFVMGLASRRGSPRITVLISFLTGLVGATLYALVQRPEWSQSSFAWGAASGVAQGTGWAILSYALTIGRVSVVMPITTTGISALLFLVGVLSGDPVTVLAVVGAIAALTAIAFLTQERAPETVAAIAQPDRPRVDSAHGSKVAPALALLVAGCFAGQALCLDRAGDEATSLVMVGARLAAVAFVLGSLMLHPVRGASVRSIALPAAAGGAALLLGDILFVFALAAGPLAVAGVLSGINPAFTIVLAAVFLRERLHLLPTIGIVFALTGSALLAAS